MMGVEWSSCRFLIGSINGRHTWRRLSALLRHKVVFITHAALSNWSSMQPADLFWTDVHQVHQRDDRKRLLQGTHAGCSAACKMHCQLTPPALFPDDIPMPWPVLHTWVKRSSFFESRDVLAFFSGTINSCSRTLLANVFRARFVSAVWASRSANVDPVLVFPAQVKLEQHEWSELAFRSKICLVPDGDSPNTGRLVEVIMHGCVPMIITNRFLPPFADYLAWRRFAFFLREDEIPLLPQILEQIVQEPRRLHDMHTRLRDVAPFLDYSWELPRLLFFALRKLALAMRVQGKPQAAQ